jgi:hypothetical protein
MPFAKAAEMLECLLGGQGSEAPARRLTERIGARVEAMHHAESGEKPEAEPSQPRTVRQAISADGASVLWVNGEWADVRTLTIEGGGPLEKS